MVFNIVFNAVTHSGTLGWIIGGGGGDDDTGI